MRYVSRPKAAIWSPPCDDEWRSAQQSRDLVVFESREPVKTGLLDASGAPIWRVDEVEMGYLPKGGRR